MEQLSKQLTRSIAFTVGQLGIACMEEIVRVVGSSGSQMAETTRSGPSIHAEHRRRPFEVVWQQGQVQEVRDHGQLMKQIGKVDALHTTPAPHTITHPGRKRRLPLAHDGGAHLPYAWSVPSTAVSTMAQVLGMSFMLSMMDTDDSSPHYSPALPVHRPWWPHLHSSVHDAQRVFRLSALNATIRALTSTWHMSAVHSVAVGCVVSLPTWRTLGRLRWRPSCARPCAA